MRFTIYQIHITLRFFCSGLVLAAGGANPVRGTTPCGKPKNRPAAVLHLPGVSNRANQTEQLSEISLLEYIKADLANFPDRIIEDSKDTFLRTDNLSALLLAGGASVAMHGSGADKNLAESFDNHRVFHDFVDESLNVIGSPWTHLAVSSLWYATSAKNQDEFNKERAKEMTTALSITGVMTMSLKAIRHNDAPNGRSWAWPSAHTASSFAVASVLDEFYGPKVGIPAYALASLVAYRMMDTGDHWASDVVFGATLGWVVGHSVAGKHKELEIAGFKVLPYTASNNGAVMGVSLLKQF